MNYNFNPKETPNGTHQYYSYQQFFPKTQPTPQEDQRKLPITSFKAKLKASQLLKAQNAQANTLGSNNTTEFPAQAQAQAQSTSSESQKEVQNKLSFEKKWEIYQTAKSQNISAYGAPLDTPKEIKKPSLKSRLKLTSSSFNTAPFFTTLENKKESAPFDNKPEDQQ